MRRFEARSDRFGALTLRKSVKSRAVAVERLEKENSLGFCDKSSIFSKSSLKPKAILPKPVESNPLFERLWGILLR